MGRFVASLLMTADGFVGDEEYTPAVEDHQVFNDLLARTEGVVFDRDGYRLLVPYWDEVDLGDPALSQVERQFAEIFRTRRRYLVSDALEQADPLATLIGDDPVGRLRDLKSGTDGDLMVAAGPELCATLLAHGLIDELEILVLPVILGSGARLFGDLARNQSLTLLGARGLTSGVVVLRYRIVEAPS